MYHTRPLILGLIIAVMCYHIDLVYSRKYQRRQIRPTADSPSHPYVMTRERGAIKV